MRRPGSGNLRRGALRGIGARAGGGAAALLDLSTGGTFTRSTEGSYLTGAPTDGTQAFLAWAAVNARRIENRGDGLGSMLLMEGSRTNVIAQSEDMSSVFWTTLSATLTGSQTAPDAATDAYRVALLSGGYLAEAVGSIPAAGFSAATAYFRSWSGTTPPNFNHFRSTAGRMGTTASVPQTAYQRVEITGAVNGAETDAIGALDGRDWSALTPPGVVAGARDHVVWGVQRESGVFPSSYIRSAGVSVTRGADVLSYAVGQYPASMLTTGFRIRFSPDASSAELIASGAAFSLVNFGAGGFDMVILSFSGGNAFVYVYDADTYPGGTAVGPVTWGRGAALDITVKPSAGSVTLAGFLTGNGTTTPGAWAWPSGALEVGSRLGGSNAFGRFGNFQAP